MLFYDFEGFRLDVQRRRLLRDGEPVTIKPKALETLVVLVEQRGRDVSKEELMNRLWPDTAVEEANLTQNVFVVRKALGEVPGEQRFIVTVARHGYRFVADVTEVRAEKIAPADATEPAAVPPVTSRRRIVAWAALAIAAASMAALVLVPRWLAPPALAPVRGVAVLPFQSLTADAEQAYFVDGMTEAVITDLASIAALRVVSHQSVRRFRDSAQPVAEIARELGVDAIVQGSVGRSGQRIRLTAQLVDARSDEHLWAAAYDREIGDVLALQGELAGAVAQAVHAALSDPERVALETRRGSIRRPTMRTCAGGSSSRSAASARSSAASSTTGRQSRAIRRSHRRTPGSHCRTARSGSSATSRLPRPRLSSAPPRPWPFSSIRR